MKYLFLLLSLVTCRAVLAQLPSAGMVVQCSCTMTDASCATLNRPQYCHYSDSLLPDTQITSDRLFYLFEKMASMGKTPLVPLYRHQFMVRGDDSVMLIPVADGSVRVRFSTSVTAEALVYPKSFNFFSIYVLRGGTVWSIDFKDPDQPPSISGMGRR